jgi:hypothetical protein
MQSRGVHRLYVACYKAVVVRIYIIKLPVTCFPVPITAVFVYFVEVIMVFNLFLCCLP